MDGPERAAALARFAREWDREMAEETDRVARVSVQVALRAVEERPYLLKERDLAIKHASNAVFYVRRLRARLDSATALIRDLRIENRALTRALGQQRLDVR